MVRFYLNRLEDATGISGTGRVAEGVIFATGMCAMAWLTNVSSVALYKSIDDVEKIHGHGGKTMIVFEDD